MQEGGAEVGASRDGQTVPSDAHPNMALFHLLAISCITHNAAEALAPSRSKSNDAAAL